MAKSDSKSDGKVDKSINRQQPGREGNIRNDSVPRPRGPVTEAINVPKPPPSKTNKK